MKRTLLIISFILILFAIPVSIVVAFENDLTHPKITEKAVNNSILSGDYLVNQLGLADGLNTELELLGQFKNNINTRVLQEPDFDRYKTKILNVAPARWENCLARNNSRSKPPYAGI